MRIDLWCVFCSCCLAAAMQAHGWVCFQGTSTGIWALQSIFHINEIMLNQMFFKKTQKTNQDPEAKSLLLILTVKWLKGRTDKYLWGDPAMQDKFVSFGVNAFFDSIIAYHFLLCLVLCKQDKFYKLKYLEHLTRLGIKDVIFFGISTIKWLKL